MSFFIMREYVLPFILIDTGDIIPDLCRSLFIAVSEKAGALKWNRHCTVRLVNHVAKIK